MKLIYAFDVDETLEISRGPVKIEDLRELVRRGHVVGICGNWMVFVNSVPDWNEIASFLGQMLMSKADFLRQLKTYIKADGYVMVGNDPAHYGGSNDIQAAAEADWKFYREDQWDLNAVHCEPYTDKTVDVKVSKDEIGTVEDDFDFFYVGCHSKEGHEIGRRDIPGEHLTQYMSNPGWFNLHWTVDVHSNQPVHSYTVWTHSRSKGWLKKIDKVVG
jgi:hypothetical protein